MTRPIYLDYQATTPLAPEAYAAMKPWLGDGFGNPHSSHRMGREAAAAVEVAREKIVETLLIPPLGGVTRGALEGREEPLGDTLFEAISNARLPDSNGGGGEQAGDLFFTSGATEAANWALKGTFSRIGNERKRIVTFATEHACVLDTVAYLERAGADVVVIGVDRTGHIDLEQAKQAIDERTAIVALMLVNNEIGVIERVAMVGEMARNAGALMFCDAAQGFGKVVVPVAACDLIALSAHKIHGPKGIGALWVRKDCAPDPLMHGGGQEGGIRSGTLSPALCAGFGAAAAVAKPRMAEDMKHAFELYERARSRFGQHWHVNGARAGRWRGNLNIRAEGLDSARLISDVRGVAFSSGSACASGSGRPSHVLRAIGLTDAEARSSIRLGFGRYTTPDELDRALDLILEAMARQGLQAA